MQTINTIVQQLKSKLFSGSNSKTNNNIERQVTPTENDEYKPQTKKSSGNLFSNLMIIGELISQSSKCVFLFMTLLCCQIVFNFLINIIDDKNNESTSKITEAILNNNQWDVMQNILQTIFYLVIGHGLEQILQFSSFQIGQILRIELIRKLSYQIFLKNLDQPANNTYEVICNDTRQLFSVIFGSKSPIEDGLIFGQASISYFVFQIFFFQRKLSKTQNINLSSFKVNTIILLVQLFYIVLNVITTYFSNYKQSAAIQLEEQIKADQRQQMFDVQENLEYIEHYKLHRIEQNRSNKYLNKIVAQQKKVWFYDSISRLNVYFWKVFFSYTFNILLEFLYIKHINDSQCLPLLTITRFENILIITNKFMMRINHATPYIIIDAMMERIAQLIKQQPIKNENLKIIKGNDFCEWENINIQSDNNTILSNFSYKIEKGNNVCLVGQSGCGKTTLLRTLAGYASIASGVVRVPCQEVCYFIPQNVYLGINKTIRQEVMFDQPVTNSLQESDKIINALKLTNLQHLISKIDEENLNHQDTLSNQEKQQLQLARLFARNIVPQFLIMDEATSFIPVQISESIFSHLMKMQLTIISVAHQKDIIQLHNTIIEVNDDNTYNILENNQSLKENQNSEINLFSGCFDQLEQLPNSVPQQLHEAPSYWKQGIKLFLNIIKNDKIIILQMLICAVCTIITPLFENYTSKIFSQIQNNIICSENNEMNLEKQYSRLYNVFSYSIYWTILLVTIRIVGVFAYILFSHKIQKQLNVRFYKQQNAYQVLNNSNKAKQIHDQAQIINHDTSLASGLIFGSIIPYRMSAFISNSSITAKIFSFIFLSFIIQISLKLYIIGVSIIFTATIIQYLALQYILTESKRIADQQYLECQLRAYYSQIENNRDTIMFYQINNTLCVQEIEQQLNTLLKVQFINNIWFCAGDFLLEGIYHYITDILSNQIITKQQTNLHKEGGKVMQLKHYKQIMFQFQNLQNSLSTLISWSAELFNLRAHLQRIGEYWTVSGEVEKNFIDNCVICKNQKNIELIDNQEENSLVYRNLKQKQTKQVALNQETNNLLQIQDLQNDYQVNNQFCFNLNESVLITSASKVNANHLFNLLLNMKSVSTNQNLFIRTTNQFPLTSYQLYYISQNNYFIRDQTLMQNICLNLNSISKEKIVEKMIQLKFKQQTIDSIDQIFDFQQRLSGGEKQRIKILKLLLNLDNIQTHCKLNQQSKQQHIILLNNITNQLNKNLSNEILNLVMSEVNQLRQQNTNIQLLCIAQLNNLDQIGSEKLFNSVIQ